MGRVQSFASGSDSVIYTDSSLVLRPYTPETYLVMCREKRTFAPAGNKAGTNKDYITIN